jgi:hypothetical protein
VHHLVEEELAMNRPRPHRHDGGQVLVLACVTLIVLALMLMLSFSLSNAIHEKIRIQSHADAAAYSTAILEARALNVAAYDNRAMAALAVTTMSVHAWMAIASQSVRILSGASAAFQMVSNLEKTLGAAHLAHAAEAQAISGKYAAEVDVYRDRILGREQDFNRTVETLSSALRAVQQHQQGVLEHVHEELAKLGSGAMLTALKDKNAAHAEYTDPLLEANAREFACAVEGSSFDDDCAPLVRSAQPPAAKTVRSTLARNAANAARGAFDFNCGGGDCSQSTATAFQDRLLELRNNRGTMTFPFTSQAFLTEGTSPVGAANDGAKQARGVTDGQLLFTTWRCVPGFASLADTHVASDAAGGSHAPGSVHSDAHSAFLGLCKADDSPCFVSFRASEHLADDFGQPSVYVGVRQQLWLTRGGQRGPWDLNDSGRASLQIGPQLETSISMRPRYDGSDLGFAVAKAKVYFHQPKRWKTAPNLFDPFWRAKLHPFTRAELARALSADGAGDRFGELVASTDGTPVEGDIRP